MNAAEKIVESYFRYVRGLYTRTSLKGPGQAELDLIGVDPKISPPLYYHVESSVSISGAYSRITNKPYDPEKEKQRQEKAAQRRTTGFFVKKKFFSKDVKNTLKANGCDLRNIKRVIVTWKFEDKAQKTLEKNNVECLTMKKVFQELADFLAQETGDIDSEILRTLQLFVRTRPVMPKIYSIQTTRRKRKKKK